jgi:hypothetical protein
MSRHTCEIASLGKDLHEKCGWGRPRGLGSSHRASHVLLYLLEQCSCLATLRKHRLALLR